VTDTKVQNTAQMILGLGLAALFFFMMAPFIVAIIVGGVIAVVCYPWQKKLSLRIPPSVSSLLINLGVLLGVLLPLVFILISSSHYLLKMVSTFQNSQTTLSVDAILNHPLLQGIIKKIQDWGIGDPEWIKTQGLGLLKTVFEGLSVFLAGVVSGMPGLFLGFTIVLISSYFFHRFRGSF
jgi:predicted PurR-regulated permease PerM